MKANKGFSLLEVLGVLAITAILIGIAAGPTLTLIERARQDAEQRTLDRMASDIQSSFQNSDLYNVNISALPGEIEPPNGSTITYDWTTTFDSPQSTPFPTNAYDTDGFPQVTNSLANQWWFVKLARLRGIPLPDLAAGNWSRAVNPTLYDLITNVYYRPRILVAEPNNLNFTAQRYMIISLMAPTHRILPIPGPASNSDADVEAWFNSIWNNNFDQGAVPAGWNAAWSQNNNAQKLKVVRITQPRFQLTVNNTSKTDGGYVYYNGRTLQNAPITGNTRNGANADIYYDSVSASVLVHFAGVAGIVSGNPMKIPALDPLTNGWSGRGILGGRRILILRGANVLTTAPNPVFDFNLNETTTITIQ